MDSGGPFTFGEFPDDFEPTESEVSRSGRGWMPPEDRLWRHPSELRPGDRQRPAATRRRRPPGGWNLVALGALGAAVAATGALYATSGSSTAPPATATATETSMVTVGADVAKVVDTVSPSLVSLVPANGSGHAAATGIVMPAGDLIVTAAAAVKSGERMLVVSVGGRRLVGEVEGVDARSGVAVVSVDQRLVPGSFVDDVVGSKQIAIAACRCDTGGGTDAPLVSGASMPEVAMGMVEAVGTGADDGQGTALLDTIEAEVPLGHSAWGSVLLDDDGGVLGVLDAERTSGEETYGYFVPSALALAVAGELAQDHRVLRGWLGVLCQDAGGAGTEVTSVLPGSPAAAAGLQPGDVVEAVNSVPVSSLADLQARVYSSPPGTRLVITVLRAGVVKTTPVTVGASPS